MTTGLQRNFAKRLDQTAGGYRAAAGKLAVWTGLVGPDENRTAAALMKANALFHPLGGASPPPAPLPVVRSSCPWFGVPRGGHAPNWPSGRARMHPLLFADPCDDLPAWNNSDLRRGRPTPCTETDYPPTSNSFLPANRAF